MKNYFKKDKISTYELIDATKTILREAYKSINRGIEENSPAMIGLCYGLILSLPKFGVDVTEIIATIKNREIEYEQRQHIILNQIEFMMNELI